MIDWVKMITVVHTIMSCSACWGLGAAGPTLEDARAKTMDAYLSVVELQSLDPESGKYRTACSGVYYKNYILTAAHCVKRPNGAFRTFDDYNNDRDNHYPYVVLHADYDKDVAILLPTAIVAGKVVPAETGSARSMIPGARVATIGHPAGILFSLSVGVLSHPGRNFGAEKGRLIQADISATTGNSGGPLFDSEGKVIGIASFLMITHLHEHFLSFFVPIEYYIDVLEKKE